MNITRKWKKILAVGCSHGLHASPKALEAVLSFRRSYRPDACLHLGDFCDTSAFRSGLSNLEEPQPIQPDVGGGLDFLEKLRPTVVLAGNHEARLWRLAKSPNAIVSHCATSVIAEMLDTCKKLKAEFIEYTGIHQGKMIGGFRYMHGVFYSENAVRDHAEAFGPVVHAHTHRAGVAKGRRSDNPTGYCVGTLTGRGAMEYSSGRRSTLSWSSGFVWGEYSGDQSVLWLHEQPHNLDEWRLPT